MSGVDGSYECVTKSPMGDQKSVFTVKSDGEDDEPPDPPSGGRPSLKRIK